MRFHIEDDSLMIIFEGVEQFWAFRHKITLNKVDIAQATWQETAIIPRKELGLRIGGTGLPGLLYAGRFIGNDGRNFVYLQRPQREGRNVRIKHVLTFDLQNGNYRRMIFTVDKPDMAEQIIAWWSGGS